MDTPARNPRRYIELDSLRGIAALTVVFHHFKQMWIDPHSLRHWHKWLMELFNPLALGHEAVMLFFVLSGFVLSIPYLAGKGDQYPVFLGRRVLRIYGPYLFALALAIAGASIWHTPLGRNEWTDRTWSHPLSALLIWQHIAFIGDYDWAQYNTAFWSLVLEMRISIIFPFLFLFIRSIRTSLALFIALCASLLATNLTYAHPPLERIAMTFEAGAIFIVGILLARNLDALSAWYGRLSTSSRLFLVLASCALYAWGHDVLSVFGKRWGVDVWLVTAGAAGFLLVALNSQLASRLLCLAVPRFLGRISYSLYLVHGTILFATVHAIHGRLPIMAQFALYVVLSIAVASIFYLCIEEPFMQLGRKLSRWSRKAKPGKDLSQQAA